MSPVFQEVLGTKVTVPATTWNVSPSGHLPLVPSRMAPHSSTCLNLLPLVLGDPKSHADGLPSSPVAQFLDILISNVLLPPEPTTRDNRPGTESARSRRL